MGYGRLEGAASATALGALHDVARLYVNFFQPSFKPGQSKSRDGAQATKQYNTFRLCPDERLSSSDRVTSDCKEQLQRFFSALDPVHLLNRIREAQRNLASCDRLAAGMR